jgi:outer membrane receptor protein involved in Fe transport
MEIVTPFNDFIRYYGGFVQDDFRVTPKLTLNFGVRLEYESGIQEENNKLVVGFDPTAANPLKVSLSILGEVGYAGVNGNRRQTGNALSARPAPRFGLAYAANDKTVVRPSLLRLMETSRLSFHCRTPTRTDFCSPQPIR